jgi:hypothetical protein
MKLYGCSTQVHYTVQHTGTVYRYIIQAQYAGTAYSYNIQVQHTGKLYRHSMQVHYTGILYRYSTMHKDLVNHMPVKDRADHLCTRFGYVLGVEGQEHLPGSDHTQPLVQPYPPPAPGSSHQAAYESLVSSELVVPSEST